MLFVLNNIVQYQLFVVAVAHTCPPAQDIPQEQKTPSPSPPPVFVTDFFLYIGYRRITFKLLRGKLYPALSAFVFYVLWVTLQLL